MIKLNDYNRKEEGEEVFISKDNIGDMKRRNDATWIYTKNYEPATYIVKETPEEILAMPDIEETEKLIDWEQRRFDLISALFVKYACSPDNLPYFLGDIIPRVDALINELKKG